MFPSYVECPPCSAALHNMMRLTAAPDGVLLIRVTETDRPREGFHSVGNGTSHRRSQTGHGAMPPEAMRLGTAARPPVGGVPRRPVRHLRARRPGALVSLRPPVNALRPKHAPVLPQDPDHIRFLQVMPAAGGTHIGRTGAYCRNGPESWSRVCVAVATVVGRAPGKRSLVWQHP